jgi:CCR4-NOT transcription complex subunit 6
MFGYCPSWALAWPYRRLNLLKELLGYNADVLCLQEVQSNHFTEFLAPEMAKAGYTAIYKKKTTEMYTRNAYAIDGCATFFRKDKFSLVKKYEVEFNKAALSLAEALPPEQKKAALHRLLKDNVALIAVLEALEPPFADGGSSATTTASGDSPTASSAPSAAPAGGAPRRQLVCVANTHIHSNPELNDVKLWQVHTLLKGLEKIAASADIPMLVAGDFNATPVSAAHSLLVEGSVPPVSPELLNDPLGILKPVNKLSHRLPLASAYQTVAASPDDDHSAQRQKRRLDPATGEPRFTNITRDFKGTLDYILYSKDSLVPSAALELPDETEVRSKSQPGLPNDQWSSDHVALMVEFQYRAPAGGGASAGGSGEEVELNQPASPPTAH